MARCLNCIHCDVCDSDRHDKERLYGDCSDFLHDADVVEVVRCKDCKYLTKIMIADDSVWTCKNAEGMVNPDPDLYCSYGERKEEE